MECMVCKKQFTGGECPRCHFPVVEFPGDPEAGRIAIQPTVNAFRKNFLTRVRLSLVAYRHRDEAGELRSEETELPFDSASALSGQTKWLEQTLARTPGALSARLRVDMDGEREERTVSVPAPSGDGALSVGLAVEESGEMRLLLRDESGAESSSDAIALFA